MEVKKKKKLPWPCLLSSLRLEPDLCLFLLFTEIRTQTDRKMFKIKLKSSQVIITVHQKNSQMLRSSPVKEYLGIVHALHSTTKNPDKLKETSDTGSHILYKSGTDQEIVSLPIWPVLPSAESLFVILLIHCTLNNYLIHDLTTGIGNLLLLSTTDNKKKNE